MKRKNIEHFKGSPHLIISLLGFVVMSLAIIFITNEYAKKTEKIFFNDTFAKLTTINEMKAHKLRIYFSYRQADIQALAASQLIENILHSLRDRKQNVTPRQEIFLAKYLHEYMYKDILLIDANSGTVLLSASQPEYTGFNLLDIQHTNIQMMQLFSRTITNNATHFSDMHKPMLLDSEPILCIATPVVIKGKTEAVLMLQLPSTIINEVMHFNPGVNETLESYAVGEDLLLRSDSTLEKNLTVKYSFEHGENIKITSLAIKKALQGETGEALLEDYRGVEVFSSYRNFQYDGISWAIVTEIDKAEIVAQLEPIKEDIYLLALFVSLMAFGIAYFGIRYSIEQSVIIPMQNMYDVAKGFEDIINKSMNEIYIFSKHDFYFSYANESAISNCGYSFEELLELRPHNLKSLINYKDFKYLIEPLLSKKVQQLKFETKHKRQDGTFYDVFVHLQLMKIDGDEKFVAIVNDITADKQNIEAKEYYFQLSTHDHLTKIYNRKMFDELLGTKMQEAQRYGFELYFVIFDIDNFKNVNDTYGHSVGDEVLISLATYVKEHLRQGDVFARWGGEEFVILISHTNQEQVLHKIEELRRGIEALSIEAVGSVTCSFGVSVLSSYEEKEQLFSRADEALYRAKAEGKNRVVFFS